MADTTSDTAGRPGLAGGPGAAGRRGAAGGPAARSLVVYAAGAVQGIVLVTAPAASTVFTSPTGYDLSSGRYGAMFVPQVITAILAALLGPRFVGRSSLKTVYLFGLGFGLVAMALLASSQLAIDRRGLAYGLLLAATAFLGAGFGLTVPVLNAMAAAFRPRGADTAVLVLNALLGLGTALAPVFVAVFVGLGFWWGLPILSGVLLLALLAVSLPLDMSPAGPSGLAPSPGAAPSAGAAAGGTAVGGAAAGGRAGGRLPRRFWLFAGFAVVYGICETTNGNWAQLDMTTDIGATAVIASITLTAFWAMVTIGRVTFASLERLVPPQWTYRILPLGLAGAFLLIAAIPRGATDLGVVLFGLAGLCCSALLPLTISFGQSAFPTIATTVSGGVIAAYQLGYGIAAFGIGPLHSAGIPLHAVYAAAAVLALILAVLAIPLTRPTRSAAARSRHH